MGPLVGATELSKTLIDAGNNLLKPHSSTVAILNRLDELESLLSTVEQNPTASLLSALHPSMKALVSADYLRNPDSDVRVFVVSCLTEIMRITAPDAPYNDDEMKEIFRVTVDAFGKLPDASCRSYRKAVAMLETVANVKSSLVMLDLECDDLVLEMLRQFLNSIRLFHPRLVLTSMETVMCTVIDESEEISSDLLEILLNAVKKDNRDVSPMASTLVEKVLRSCASKLQPCIMKALNSKGTSLEFYSPVVLSICQSENATTQALNVVEAKGNEADEKISERRVVSSDSFEEKSSLGHSRKGNRSNRTARVGIRQANGDDKARNGNDLKKLSRQGQTESTDAETESGSTRKRKPNSLMNPEEGYPFKTSSSKQEKNLGGSSVGKLAAKKASLPTKVGQTNQSVLVSPSSSSKAKTGSRKRSRTKMDEMDNDVASIATSTSKKQITRKDNPEEEDFIEPTPEKPDTKACNKEKAQNGSVKTFAKKPLAETKIVKTRGKKAAHLDSKKNKSEDASIYTPILLSSKSKKKISSGTTPSIKKSEQTLKSHPKKKQVSGEELESNSDGPGEELVGKRVNVWWPLDQEFYEGVIGSYTVSKKTHRVFYVDGDAEELDLRKERFEIIQDNSSASEDKEIDLPESVPLSVLIQRHKVKKSKKVSMIVEPSSSPEVRSSVSTAKNRDPETDSTKQAKRTKGAIKAASKELESKEGKNLKSSKELYGESGRTISRTGKRQKVTRAIKCKSENDCDEGEDPETEGEDSLKFGKESNAEPDCMGEHQELSENQDAETKSDVKERNLLKESNEGSKIDGKEQYAAKEPTAEPKTGEEEQKVAKETSPEPEADEEEQKPLDEKNVEPKTEKSVKEPDAEPKTKVEEKESAKEQAADTKTIEKEDMSEAEAQENDEETKTSMAETSKVENEAKEDDQKVLADQREEAEVGRISGSG